MARGEFRILKLISIFDEHVYDLREGGRSKSPGVPSTSRGQIEHMLRKRVEINGQTFPTYLLAEEPPENPDAHDEWDSEWLRDKAGEWHAPYDAWLRVRGVNIAAREERRDAARAEAARRMGETIVRGMAKIAADGQADVARRNRDQRDQRKGPPAPDGEKTS